VNNTHGRLRLMVAISQALSLGALAAAVTPLFRGAPAPLGLTVLLIAASVALGFGLGLLPQGNRTPGDEARLRAAEMGGVWAVTTVLLLALTHVPEAQVFVWAIVGFTAALAAFGAVHLESEEGARTLATRSALAALAAGAAGALLGRGLLPGPAALALVALLVAAIVHAMARAHYRAVDPDRVGRQAVTVVAVVAALAVVLAIGPVHNAVGVAVAAIWTAVAYALTIVAIAMGYLVAGVIALIRLLLHPHAFKAPAQATHPAKQATHPIKLVHASPLLAHLGPLFLLLLAGAIAVWLAGHIRRTRAESDAGLYRDEILRRGALGQRRRGASVRRPPAEGLARAYAQALAVLAHAQDSRAHPRAADTPSAVTARAAEALGADGEALDLFQRLSAAYAEWHYGHGPNLVPDATAQLLRRLRQALPPARRTRPQPPG
jgi:hypothetical protein